MSRILYPLLFGLIGAGILVSLGVWQIQRLAWKEEVLARIEARISGAPIELPTEPDPEEHRYAPVALTGEVGADELYVLTSRKRVGAGHLVISPFTTEDGRTILLDRGFVRTDQRDEIRPTGPASIRGHINWPDDRTSSTPDNDVGGNIWFARDVAAMAEALKTEPLMVILAQSDTDLGTTPLAVDTANIPNDHLNYAITWFSLAAIWLVMTGFFITRVLKREA
ncbi:SURF1 family protein [Primorskyibacter sp. S187A]|uniref:SURF1 family protein n=1 Tax=Primorskyibacter sp. S187A TaxID=3415130 RepID=UPI003C7AB88E